MSQTASTCWEETDLVSLDTKLLLASFLLSLTCVGRHGSSGPSYFSEAVTEAKGYIKVQVISTCVWLWESPTRPLSLYAVCLHDPPHSLTIYAADDSSPWSLARAQWRQASGAMAALLALHQKPRKNLIKAAAWCLLPCTPPGAGIHLWDSNGQSNG